MQCHPIERFQKQKYKIRPDKKKNAHKKVKRKHAHAKNLIGNVVTDTFYRWSFFSFKNKYISFS